ncbi:hypothetical protein [Aliamphritea spongicola]|nr:hypothetical protein [Aliamphritea spongicola]
MMLILPVMTGVWNPLSGNLYVLWLQTYLIYLPFIYLFVRCVLIFPAIAIDAEERGPVMAWRLSKGNGWRLVFLIALLPMLTDLLGIALLDYAGAVAEALQIVVWAVCGVIEVGLISLSYAWLRDNNSTAEDEVLHDIADSV